MFFSSPLVKTNVYSTLEIDQSPFKLDGTDHIMQESENNSKWQTRRFTEATDCASLVIFSKKAASAHLWYYSKCKGFHQWATGSVIIVLPWTAIDSDLTDISLD